MSSYDTGDGVTLSTVFTSADTGEPTDPTDVFLDVRRHNEVEPTTYQLGDPDGTIVSDGEGAFHALLTAGEPGLWHYGWRGTGDVVAAEQSEFIVRRWRPGIAEVAS